jgi:LPXTG-motif cell wall-anchored protein
VNCAKGGVDVTAANQGDADFAFQLAGKKYTVAPGGSRTVTVPVDEDQAYSITITGPEDFTKTFEGVLDCETAVTVTSTSSASPSSSPSTASVGGTSLATTGNVSGDLAETGTSSATPVIAGIAIALVVVGGGAVFLLRKKKPGRPAE